MYANNSPEIIVKQVSNVCFSVSAGRRFCSPILYRVVFIACGLALLGLGGLFIAKAI